MIRKRYPFERTSKATTYILLALAGVVCLAIGLLSLAHPIGQVWALGEGHRADLPGVLGVGVLVFPVFLIGLAAYRTWWTLELDFEAWRQRRKRRRRQSGSTE